MTGTEPDTRPVSEAVSEAAGESVAKRVRRSGRIATVLTTVAVVVGGVGYTAVTVDGAERDAGAPVWEVPEEPAEEEEQAPASKSLAGALVPFGTYGWARGPDLGEFGSDVQLSGDRATALQKGSLRGLPRSERRQLEKEIDRRHVEGMAMRSYVTGDGPYEDVATVSIVLARMDRAAVREIADLQWGVAEALDTVRKGPEIEGHENAKCFLPAEELDTMLCTAYVGDVLVTATADGLGQLFTERVAVLLTEQLDRISDPGEAV